MPFGERVLFSGAVAGGASVSAASSGDNSVSTILSSGLAAPAAPSGVAADFGSEGLASEDLVSEGLASEGLGAEGLASALPRVSFLSPFLSDGLSDLSAAGSRIGTRS